MAKSSKKIGFAAMDSEEQRRIASKGGKASHKNKGGKSSGMSM